MTQNRIITFLSLIFIGLVYLVFILAAWLTRGKNGFIIKQKLKIGVYILLATGFLSLMSHESCIGPTVLCYKPAPQNYFTFTQMNEEYKIIVDAKGDRIIKGIIRDRLTNAYFFQIKDEEGNKVLQQGEVLPADGKFEDNNEEIQITVSKELPPGTYFLAIIARNPDGEDYPVYLNHIIIS